MRFWGRIREWREARYAPRIDDKSAPVPDSPLDRLRIFLQHLHASGVAAPSDLTGCASQEIAELESQYGVRLPATYRWYLEAMGHKSGRLFKYDHWAVYFSDVLTMTARHRQMAIELPEEPIVVLPDNALIIAGRLGEQFHFIRCDNPDDSPVWYFNEWDNRILDCKSSVIYWLYTHCDEAQHAIEKGYFDIFPDGTTP
jgi:hypothetical protein